MQSEILLKALLDDQVNAARGQVEFLFPMGYTVNEAAAEFMVDYSLERDIQMDEVSDLIAYLDNYEQAKLLVFWSEDDDEMKKIVKTALDQGLEVRDLCDALTRLGALPDYKEPQMAVEEDTLYTESDLVAMDEDEITRVGQGEYGLDPTEYETWDLYVEAILKAQDESMTETKAIESDPETMAAVAEANAETAGAGEVLPTLKELSEMERQSLVDLVETNELVPMMWDKTDKAWVPMQRPRVPALIRAIWIAIDGPFSGDGNPDDPNNEPIEREGAEVAAETLIQVMDAESPSGMVEVGSLEVDLSPVLEAVEDLKNFVDNRYGHLLAAITAQSQLIGTLGRSMDNLTAEIKTSKPEAVPGQIVPAKAVGAIKKGLRRPPG